MPEYQQNPSLRARRWILSSARVAQFGRVSKNPGKHKKTCFFARSRLRRFFRENKDFEKRNAVFMGIQKTRKPEIEM